ncbi:hypothetical protein LTR10_020763 [Elasticomyces elasticus]|nr:hypothetical protein LTR10_020763 [Elasticomyces elasticus]KAK5181670.1 hypothetical protein LTR44_005869 [Eurotiomycetes sp. CCFEE 6388]
MDDLSSPGPRPIRLELEADTQISSGKMSLPLIWKRLQFKNSTANNGRRNGVQQKYRLKLTLTANLATGEKVPIVEAESGAIIVRGRSAWTSAKGEEADPSIQQKQFSSQVVAINAHHTGHLISRYENTPVRPSDQAGTSSPVGSLPTEKPLSPFVMLDLNSGFEHSTIMSEQTHSLHSRPERTTSMTKVVHHRAAEQDLSSDALHVGSAKDTSSTSKPPTLGYLNSDPLYEYFPLGIEGWMPPVDAVYRPHVAHNTSLAPDLQALVDKVSSSWTGPHAG